MYYHSPIDELRKQINESNKILFELDRQISDLKSRAKINDITVQRNAQNIIIEKLKLEKENKNQKRDIQEYKSQLIELQKKVNSQNEQVDALKKENQLLRARIRSNSRKSPRKKIKGISDLRQSFGLELKVNSNDENEDEINLGTNEKGEEFQKLKKAKMDSEITFHKLQNNIIGFYKEIYKQKTYIKNYRNYIYSVNNQIRLLGQQLRVSVVGSDKFNFANKLGKNFEQLTKDMETILYIINQLNDYIYTIENKTLKKAESFLIAIHSKLFEINQNKKLSFGFLSNRMYYIERQIDNLKQICQMLNKNLADIINKRKQIENYIEILKKNIVNFINNFKEGKKKIKDAIRKTIRNSGKDIFGSINKNLRNEENDENDKRNNEICGYIAGEEDKNDDEDDDLINGSTLVGINDFGKNAELFKTIVLFKKKNEREENKIKHAKILRKNWNEICYIYDDFDLHDINFKIKAVGLGPFSFFNSCSNGFYIGKDIEIIDFEINGKSSKYTYNNYCLEYNINLRNLQTAIIHLKYKERPKFK